jgi:hypothetical protein
MAAISSNTDVALANLRMLWSNTSSWVGGVVPTVLDDVTITSTRTTINQSNISKWTGTITITVASTSGFPSTGFFYTYTNFSDYVKVNYTGTTATSFTGCSIDYTDPLCDWKYSSSAVSPIPTYNWNYGSVIGNGYYVYAPSPIITIPAGYQANVSTLIIGNGGILSMEPGSNLGANNWITLREGRFTGRANVGNVSTVMVNRLEGNGIGYFQTENYPMSILDVDGGESRAYGTLNADSVIGNTKINLTMVQGTLAEGDEIAIYDTLFANNKPIFYPYRDIQTDTRNLHDEGFDVAGVSGNIVSLARRNGARGKIKQVGVSGSQKVLTVDKNDFIGQLNFKANDRVIIANTEYTIAKVVDSEFQLGFYDFTAGSNLNDFLMDYTSYNGWAIDGYGAYPTASNAMALVHKQFFRREMIVEAFMSPLNQFTTGSRGVDQYGILFGYDPNFRYNTRNNNIGDGVLTGSLRCKDAGTSDGLPWFGIQSKSGNGYVDYYTDTSADPNTPTLRTILQGPNTQKIEVRNNFIKGFVNGELVTERWDCGGSQRGLFGVFAWNNTNVRVKTIKFSAVTQDLYITTSDNFTVNSTVYESGAELAHWAGERVLKIASKVTGMGTHDDLAFAYRGGYGTANTWPLAYQYNGTNLSTDLYKLNNHDFTYAHELHVDLGTAANTSVTFDLGTATTFTHAAFTPRVDDTGHAAGTIIKGVWIQGSNDNSSWTTIYGPVDDTKRYCNPQSDSYPWYNQIGYYNTGSQTYRYVKFITNGSNGASNPTLNRWIKFGLFNFASNTYTIQVNNASDFSNGDTVMVMSHALYMNNDDFHHYQAVKAGQNLENYFHTANSHSTVINVIGNTLYLDRPINYGFVEGQESVVKINRNFKMLGFLSANGETKYQKPYFKVNQGTAQCQIRSIKNWQFYYVGSSRVSGGSFVRGVDIAQQDYWNYAIVDGISVIGYNNSDANGLTFQQGQGVCRNGFVGNVRDYRPYYTSYYSTISTLNMKVTSVYRWRPEVPRACLTNYNEVAGARQWDVYGVANPEPYIAPGGLEYRRNNTHGLYQIPSFDFGYRAGDTGWNGTSPFINEYNRHYATAQNPWNNGVMAEHSAPIGLDIHAEHPGSRLSNYRNEPFLSWFNNANDQNTPVGLIKDFMRSNVNICANYAGYQLYKQIPGTDYIRNYQIIDDLQAHRLAFTTYCKAAVPIQMFVEFEYRMPGRVNLCGNVSINFSKLWLIAVQNGAYVSGYGPLQLPLPTNDGWVKFSTTITTFTPQIGNASVFIARRDPHSFYDIRNARAYVMTNNPESVITMANTFDLNKYFNLTNDKKYMAPISTGANKFKKVKF